jgi:virulence-associated protein VapD
MMNDEFLNAKEVEKFLKVTKYTLLKWEKEFPEFKNCVYRVKRLKLYKKSELMKAMEMHKES